MHCLAALIYSSGQRFGPQLENYFTLRSQGGPLSSIAGERTTTTKAGSPPQPPAFEYKFDPKRADAKAADGDAKAAGGAAPKAGAKAGRRLTQSE
jgi:hypothetical protein